MKSWKRIQATLLAGLMVLNMAGPTFANQAVTEAAQASAEDIVVLYTNDIHTHIDNEGLRYSNVAALKKDLAATGTDVLLVDAGDHIQGTAYGSMDKGATMINLMNASG